MSEQISIEDMLEDSPPAKKAKGRPKGSTKQDAPPRGQGGKFVSSKTAIREGIAGLYQTVGVGLYLAPSLRPAGEACVAQANEIADAWLKVCETNPAIKKFWESMLQSSNAAALFAAHLPIVMALVQSRPEMLGNVASKFGGGKETKAEASSAASSASPPPPPPAPPRKTTNGADDAPFNPAFGGPIDLDRTFPDTVDLSNIA